jgi:integrase
MPARQLTARFVDTVKTHKLREEIRDREVEGLELRVTNAGTKTWCLRYRRHSDLRKRSLTIGRYPDYSLLDARNAAEDARRVVARGGDPGGEKQVRKAAETFEDIANQWLVEHCKINLRRGTYDNYRTALQRHIFPRIGGMKAAAVSRRDVSQMLSDSVRALDQRFAEKPARKTRPRSLSKARRPLANPNRVFATVRAAYRWALGQGIIEVDPTWGMKAPLPEPPPRDRVLTPAEIRRFWHKLDLAAMREADRIMCRLALVTAQRIGEVSTIALKHLEITSPAPVWMIPGAMTKNGETHKVWLSPLALRLVNRARELSGSEWLFPLSNKDAPMRTPNIVDLLKVAREVIGIEDFRLHDLRRTAATYMGEMGIGDRDIEGILNHISGQRGVTRRHYDKARREHAKRKAMLLWSAQLEALIEGRNDVQSHPFEPVAPYGDTSRQIEIWRDSHVLTPAAPTS